MGRRRRRPAVRTLPRRGAQASCAGSVHAAALWRGAPGV